ncbi:MAG: TlpA family protein disulfide reductase [Planctomyces sp.]|nr:TlpA family protein disulfide reductase [Planctomyces sp.]
MTLQLPVYCLRKLLRLQAVLRFGAVLRLQMLPVFLLGLCISGIWDSAAADEGMLHWVSGDSLGGDITAASSEEIVWQSPLFEEALNLDPAALAGIVYPKIDVSPDPADPFRVSLVNGDVVFGSLLQITEAHIELRTSRHGDIRIGRNLVRNLIRVDNPGLVYLGPQGLKGWRHPVFSSWTTPPGWDELPGGQLTTFRPEAVMFRAMEFPDQCEIEVILSSTAIPSFVMSLGTNPNSTVRLETWSDVLVARNDKDFVRIEELKSTQRRVHLFLYIDFVNGKLVVTSAAGKKLAEMLSKESDFGVRGLLFRNGERDLTVEYLSVSRWDGNELQGAETATNHVQLASGAVLEGEVAGLSPDGQILRMQVGDELRELPINDIRNLSLAHATDGPAPGPVQVSWSDGTVISGVFAEATPESFRMQVPWSEGIVSSFRHGVHRLTLPGTLAAQPEPDTLYFEGGSLQGNLKMEPGTTHPVLWQPIGSRNAVSLRSSDRARFLRGARQTEPTINLTEFPDVVYLSDDSVLPCRLLSVSNEKIEIASPLTAGAEVLREHLRAVELTRQSNTSQRDFSDSGWKRVVGSVDQRPDSIAFRASEAMGHADILTGDVVHFRLSWGELVTADVVFNLYTAVPTSHQTGKTIAFQCRGTSISVHDGAVINQRARNANNEAAHTIGLRQRSASVTIFRQGNKISVSVDGRLAETFDYIPPEQELRGLLIRANIINQNRGRQGEGRPKDVNENVVRISDFEVCDVVGGAIRKFIDDEARNATLTIPRFRRDHPPTHVLLAPNGDLLRGELLSVDAKELQFESRLDKLRLPRERVAGIIWLKPVEPALKLETPGSQPQAQDRQPADGSPAAAPATPGQPTRIALPEGTLQLLLDDGYQLQVRPLRMEGDQLVGESQLLGECRVAVASIQELMTGQWSADELTAGYEEWVPRFASDPVWPVDVAGEPSPEAKALLGKPAPGFEVPLNGGGMFRMDDARDRVVVIDFWASWCGPCTGSLPKYARVCEEFDPTQVIFLPVNLKESPDVVRDFLDKRKLQFPVALDTNGDVGKLFHVAGIPHTVVISRRGLVHLVKTGYSAGDEDKLRETIQGLLFGVSR